MRLKSASKGALVCTIMNHTEQDAHIMTDEHRGYKSVGKIRKHESVNHIKEEWVRGNVHTNSIENYWSLFKRGSFHQVSVKHLDRFNNRHKRRLHLRARYSALNPIHTGSLCSRLSALNYSGLHTKSKTFSTDTNS